ncbi:MAG: hypothetical protein AB2693_33070 [Candidatus Thiodiazotropha sp.]
MKASRQEQTKVAYESAYKAFNNWCKVTKQMHMPASTETIALYLVSLVQAGASKAKLIKAFYSINWFHRLAGVRHNPCENSAWLKLCLDGCCRLVARPVKKKEPISIETLKSFINKFAGVNCSLSDLRISTLVLLSFAGFLRFREVTKLRRSDINFCSSYCTIFISESKTDVYRLGNRLAIARTGSSFCPVNLLERYLAAANITDSNSDEYIFRAIMYEVSSKSQKLRPDRYKALSYSTVRSIFLHKLSELGLNPNDYGLHSMRSGGATISANNGTIDRLWKRHGRWTSETAKDGYVADDLHQRLSVTLGLGL